MTTWSLYGLPFVAGVVSFASPCIIPMVSVYLSLITGLSMEQLLQTDLRTRLRKGIILNTFYFILGFTLVFTIAGGFAGWLGKVLRDYLHIWEKIGGVFVVLFGLHLAGFFRLPWLEKLKLNLQLKPRSQPTGIMGALLIGFFFALVCSHCIAPMLYSTLIYSGILATPQLGALSMLSFSIGLGIPYLLVALFLSVILIRLKQAKSVLRWINVASGILLVGLGIVMLLGKFTTLSSLISRVLPYRLPVGM